MFKRIFEKQKKRVEAVQHAREQFVSWLEISSSKGWKAYEDKIDKEIEIIKNQMETDTTLTGEDLKRLQLALRVWYKVKLIPKQLKDDAKGGVK